MGYLSEARAALGAIRKTGKFLGENINTSDFKSAVRMMYHEHGPDEMSRFMSNWPTSVHKQSVLTDAKYGYDEVMWPKGEAKLPKGTLGLDHRAIADQAMQAKYGTRPAPAMRSMTDAQKRAMIARKRSAKYGPKG